MPTYKRVTDKEIFNAKPGVYTIIPNLLLRVSKTGAKSWVLRYFKAGKINQIGLGAYPNRRTLKEACDTADEMRDDVAKGREPMERIRPTPGKTVRLLITSPTTTRL